MSLDNLPRAPAVKAPDVEEDTDQELSGDIKFFTLPVILGPNITGKLGIVSGSIYGASGAFSRNSERYSRISASVVANAEAGINFSASNSNSIYGDSTTVQPNTLVFNYVIKY